MIAPFALKDCGEAAQLHKDVFYKWWTEKDFQDFLNDPLVHGLKIQKDGTFCGSIIWREIPPEAEILTLVIAPSSQRKGLGHRLLKALFEQLKEKGITHLFLEVAEDNKSAQSFYIKNGFIISGKRQNYYARAENRQVDGLNFLKIIE